MNAPFLSAPRALMLECQRDSAWDNAMAWDDSPKARGIVSRILMLERLSDSWANDPLLANVRSDVSCAAENMVHDELYHARQGALREALTDVSDESGYEFDRLDTNAPTVEEVVDRARKLPCLGAAARGPQL